MCVVHTYYLHIIVFRNLYAQAHNCKWRSWHARRNPYKVHILSNYLPSTYMHITMNRALENGSKMWHVQNAIIFFTLDWTHSRHAFLNEFWARYLLLYILSSNICMLQLTVLTNFLCGSKDLVSHNILILPKILWEFLDTYPAGALPSSMPIAYWHKKSK